MSDHFDFAVIGSGPGGQKAAICAAKAGCRVALIERERELGGACVLHGTIPSKTLRENAIRVGRLRDAAARLGVEPPETLELAELVGRLNDVVHGYAATVGAQLERNGVECLHGRGIFVSPHELEVQAPDGTHRRLHADTIVIAVGSEPRVPDGIPIDHEHVLDSDSILALAYVPGSLVVLGSGVIACEYASIFAELGVAVTIVDRGPRPLGFLDPELSDRFRADFEAAGGRYLPERRIASMAFDGVSRVALELEGGERLEAEKVLAALGRTGCLAGLGLAAAGLEANARGVLAVDEHGRTEVSHIYAVGDVAGPPALATAAMEQGRQAVNAALGRAPSRTAGLLPAGIYTIPEMACVGMTEEQAADAHGAAWVGRASFGEVARGQISGAPDGLLKLVAEPGSGQLLGVHICGEFASELVHIGQMALLAHARLDDLIENVFNFPTLAEAYRIAALNARNRATDEREKSEDPEEVR